MSGSGSAVHLEKLMCAGKENQLLPKRRRKSPSGAESPWKSQATTDVHNLLGHLHPGMQVRPFLSPHSFRNAIYVQFRKTAWRYSRTGTKMLHCWRLAPGSGSASSNVKDGNAGSALKEVAYHKNFHLPGWLSRV